MRVQPGPLKYEDPPAQPDPKHGGGDGGATGAKAEQGAAKAEQAVVKAEETAIKAESKAMTVARRAGSLALDILLPGPLDAVGLMLDIASAYAEAHDAIRQRSFREGFALGFSAGLLALDRQWINENLLRRFVMEDRVISEVLGATGLYEKTFNKALRYGHSASVGLPSDHRNALRGYGYSLLRAEDYRTTEQSLFSIETVARMARVLRLWITSVFNELELFVNPIGKAGESRMGPMAGDVPTTITWSSVTRAVWVNIAPGQRYLALIEEGSIGSSLGSPTARRRLNRVPDRMVPLALARTKAIFGKVDEIDGFVMDAMRRHK